jgi:cytochrome b subunit of formate dehydrogenase
MRSAPRIGNFAGVLTGPAALLGLVGLVGLVLSGTVVAQRASQPPAGAPAPTRLGDHSDGSRARPVHRIPLRDAEGQVIRPTDRPLLPFSTMGTCGDCHDVAAISKGWHFNVTTPGAAGARPGEPWILTDPDTATQLPLSPHGWPGTYRPEQVGLTPWTFARVFGARTVGGLTGARESSPDLRTRWVVSGDLEPNCLACHDNSPAYDHAEFGRQVGLENFRWAAAGASGLATVTGTAREMPNTFDYLMPMVEDALRPRMPAVAYTPERFLPDAKVVLDIVREVPTRRCYFCHTSVDTAHTGEGRWNSEVDVHVARGMSCVDCHRNGLDHQMTRGYDRADRDQASRGGSGADLTCAGCHLADEPNRVFANGRAGAPFPKHAGLPPLHFEKLSCTACHSGPQPEVSTRRLKTSQAHRLGGLNVNKSTEALPHLSYPVFARQADGVTTPNRMLWPVFWGRMVKNDITPLVPDGVKLILAKARIALTRSPDGSWPALDDATVAKILGALGASLDPNATAVYVAGGKLRRLNASGAIVAGEHPAAQPYLWPIAHDVRPAALALGARGCQDCHDAGAPIFFGKVAVDSPLAADRSTPWTMSRFQAGFDPVATVEFADAFRYRSWLKITLIGAVGALLLIVAGYAMTGLTRVSAATTMARWTRWVANAVGAASAVAIVASGWPELLSGQPLVGARLLVHVTAAPIFLASCVLVALFWAHRNRFGRADWNRLCRPIGVAAHHGANPYLVLLRKVAFWAAAVAVIPAAVSATLAMFPILASIHQPTLFAVHRYAAAVLSLAGALFAVLAIVSWMRRHRDDPDPSAAPPTPAAPADPAP